MGTANGIIADAPLPPQLPPQANGHAPPHAQATLEQLRRENAELQEKVKGVDKRIAGAAAVQVRACPSSGLSFLYEYLVLATHWC